MTTCTIGARRPKERWAGARTDAAPAPWCCPYSLRTNVPVRHAILHGGHTGAPRPAKEAGERGRVTAVTQVLDKTCVTIMTRPARAGRHFSPQEQAEIAAARRVDVQALRERGMTMQAIAERVGVGETQIRSDLRSSIPHPCGILHPAAAAPPEPTISPRQQEVLSYIRAHGPLADKDLVEHFDGNLSIETRRVELLKAGVIEDSGERAGPLARGSRRPISDWACRT